MAGTPIQTVDDPQSLLSFVAGGKLFAQALALVGKKKRLAMAPCAEAGIAFLVALIAHVAPEQQRIWVLAPHLRAQDRIASELRLWNAAKVLYLPEREQTIASLVEDPEVQAERLGILQTLAQKSVHKQIVVLAENSLDDIVPSSKQLGTNALTLQLGDEYEADELILRLSEAGFERVDQVIARGQWAQRGGIVDIYPLQASAPLRIEFFGDEIESLREFDIDSQVSFRKLKQAELVLEEPPADEILRHWIAPNDWVISTPFCKEPGDVLLLESVLDDLPELYEEGLEVFDRPLGNFETGDFVMQEAKRAMAQAQVKRWQELDWKIAFFFSHPGEEARFGEICGGEQVWNKVEHFKGDLARGFSIPSARLVVLSAAEIFGRFTTSHARNRDNREDASRKERAQTSLREINPGDLVVHLTHGLGRFVKIAIDPETQEEEMEILYKGSAVLRLPLRQAHLVSRYVGMGNKTPDLSKLGDKKWARACKSAQNAVDDYAAKLLEVQSERDAKPGYAHAADSQWVWDFESSFPYRETTDQLRAIQQTKADMEQARPMDRLICGDVGFGKTEVALRAAFKCMMGGKQAALLVPTTVLADQHGRNFKARMSEYPVRVEVLSRFTTAADQRLIMAGLANGSVDMVIGTHRIISADIQFANLGLLIIDEEQRFGVRHKEALKERYRSIDMLTLSATPIPRTLYSALMGARDMSSIETPPLNRLPVQTSVCPYDERIVQDAILREMSRGGQVFFLHNRVHSIENMAAKLQKLVPKARIVIGHGQMDQGELETVMQSFINGEADILLSTTIIESGIDIPNANTIIIDRADRFGLADLYQLRGRVGRSDHLAYAYLMLPASALTTADARKRVSAIRQYTALGSGFKIAMRDLEIRGAGNLLGTQQSGHIAAIGFELYCQLLRQSVEKLKGNAPSRRTDATLKADFLVFTESSHQKGKQLGAYIPRNYISSTQVRITAYKTLANINKIQDIDQLEKQWRDRFGRLPQEAENLLLCTRIKLLASCANISAVEIQEQKLMLTRNGDYIHLNNKFPRLKSQSPLKKLRETAEMLEKI